METGQYKTPGAMIKEAREAKGVSLVELAAETRISQKILEALEDDNYALLNSPIYIRSFLNACAVTLGMDSPLLLKHYELIGREEEREARPEEIWQSENTHVHRVSVFSGPVRRGLIVAVAVIAVIVVAVFWMRGREAPTSSLPETTAESTVTPGDSTLIDSNPIASDAAGEAATGSTGGSTTDAAAPGTADVMLPPDQQVLTAMESLPDGDRSLRFADESSWPIVMRLVFSRPTGFAIGRDRDSESHPVVWPASVPRGVPDEDIEPGRIYQVGSRFVSYWGANDHFLLKLDSAEGVTVTLNGSPLSIPTRIVGREWVLDAAMVGR